LFLFRLLPSSFSSSSSSERMEAISSCTMIKNVLLLDSEGKRVAVKYYDTETDSAIQQLAFERSLFQKTVRSSARNDQEVVMFNGNLVVYKFISDVHFYVTAKEYENELILSSVLQGFFESISLLLRGLVEKRTVLENLDLVLLVLDELVDGGVILETDSSVIANRVSMRGTDNETPLAEQSFAQAIASARDQISRNLLR